VIRVGLVLALFSLVYTPVYACTIFVLTDANRALFCNNEDWVNPKTRIWFVPAHHGYYGCAIVGFDDGGTQGGVNTEGLAFDVVAGYSEKWELDPNVPYVWGNSGRLVLETCATVEEAVAFYRSHREPGFSRCKMLVADRTGASVILGAKGGRLQVEISHQSRGFGYGSQVLGKMLLKAPEPIVSNGFAILRACLQQGQSATKYSNVFDLRSGDIFLAPFPGRSDEVKLNLAVELRKGGHYYDMPEIHKQLVERPRPLLANMKRNSLAEMKPIPDKEPEVATHVRTMLHDLLVGTPKAGNYDPEVWMLLLQYKGQPQAMFKSLGELTSLTLVDRSDEDGRHSYYYRTDFQRGTLLQKFDFDRHSKLTNFTIEDGKAKPGVGAKTK
jgi:hypothetical protein